MIRIIECEQGSDEWRRARLGMPTASEFHSILAKGQGKMRKTYLYKLLGERLTGEPAESFSNDDTERGKALEDEARRTYAFIHDAEPSRVGFVVNGRAGCSPDGFVGTDGVIEIKTKAPHLLLQAVNANQLPPEHVAQVQGALWVCEREWCDFIAYWRKLPLFVLRIFRDEDYIKALALEVGQFNDELDALTQKMKART